MKIGSFLEYILNNEHYSNVIKTIDVDFYNFIKECIICDLIYIYNQTNEIVEVSSNDLIEIYYEIFLKHKDKLHPNLNKIVPSNGQEKFRVCIRNTINSNSNHPDGLQNRKELSFKISINPKRSNQYSVIYKLSDELLNFDIDNIEYRKITFIESFKYMYNFRKYFVSKNIECICGNNKKIFMHIKKNRNNKIPLPISGDFEYKCARCMLEANLKGISHIFN